ncbi:MAG: MATE family efflux transporter [Deltaproteobacteria bacterium]|nr:MATE family efflux transporter [Deltaproteobacteria bacterium]
MPEENPLLTGDIATVLRKQSIPMAIGAVCMILVNLIDTYWASQLGTDELAALSFTFPVIGILINVSIGLMIGTSVAIARVIGSGHIEEAKNLATHAIYLGFMIVGFVSFIGLISQEYLFAWLGADEKVLPHITSFMTIWYASSIFLIVPMMINGVLRAKGDARTPMIVMMMGAVFNGIFDPIFIFTLDMGLEGAAWATTLSRALTMLYASYILIVREKLFDLHIPSPKQMIESWKVVLRVGVPASITNVLGPVATAMLTAIVATHGSAAVAAYGIGARVESLVLIAPLALSSGLSPFIGQNWGAHLEDRVAKGFQLALNFSILWGLGAFLILLALAPQIAVVFSEDKAVQEAITLYLRVVPIGFASYGAMLMVNSSFNAMDHAFRSSVLSVLRSIVFAVPLAWVGSHFLALEGVFLGLACGSFFSVLIGIRWMRNLLSNTLHDHGESKKEISEEIAYLITHTCKECTARMHSLIDEMLKLEKVSLHKVRSDAVGFFVESRQLGHIHPSGHVDLPLPMELGQVLVKNKKVTHHRLHEDNGWFTHELHNNEDIDIALWLLELSHAIYEVRTRGLCDDLTQQEIAHLNLSKEENEALMKVVRRIRAFKAA